MEEYRVYNEKFIKAAADTGLLDQVRSKEENYIRTMIYDKKPLARTILNATPVTMAEMSKYLNNEAYVIVDIQGDQKLAFEVPFTADVPTQYIDVPQAKFSLYEIDTEEFVKNLTEILFLNHSFSDEVEEHADQAIFKREDRSFFIACTAAVAATGQVATVIPAPGQTYLYKENFITLLNILPSVAARPLRVETLVMNEITWTKIMNWNKQEFGDEVGKITINGIDFNTLLGKKVITTLKSDIVITDTVWGFAPPENFGIMRVFQDITLFMEKKKKDIYYWFHEQVIGGIANSWGVAELILP
jgi:hypothetical protein